MTWAPLLGLTYGLKPGQWRLSYTATEVLQVIRLAELGQAELVGFGLRQKVQPLAPLVGYRPKT